MPGPGPGQTQPYLAHVESTRTKPSLDQWASVGVAGLGGKWSQPMPAGGHPACHLPPPIAFPTPAAGAFHPVSHSWCHLSLGDNFTLITLIKRH